tara:strand:- start:10015 stop:10476 length:462 start_codon:yes stop_codon:yes gene_type:complete
MGSGRGKKSKGLGSGAGVVKKSDQPSKSRSAKAGLHMPVSKINRHLKDSKVVERVGQTAPVYIAAALEYAAAEVLELAGKRTEKDKRKRISPDDFTQAIRNDVELNKLAEGMVFFVGDRMNDITAAVTIESGKKSKKSMKGVAEDAEEDAEEE